MAESYHVPQQSRRDKLRVPWCVDTTQLYDPSDLLNCAATPMGGLGYVVSQSHRVTMDPQLDPFLYQPCNGGQGLFLSLSSHGNDNNPVRFDPQRCGGGVRSSVPLGPFTGYASVLNGSRFLKPAQKLMEELCGAGKLTGECLDSPAECLDETGVSDEFLGSGDRRKKSRLISMLDEVFKRYTSYYQQMQAVVASFESVAGLRNAAPFANLALKSMYKHFKCLKKAITDQLQNHMNCRKDDSPKPGHSNKYFYSQKPVNNNSGFMEHQPVWRPQRGLPERAVSVLRAWLFEHFLHPYPTDTDKLMLAKQTGLSRSQVSNWFINARVRLWKPMVEEIHMLETRQAQKCSRIETPNVDRTTDNPSTTSQRTQVPPFVRSRSYLPVIANVNEQPPMSLYYENLARNSHVGGTGVSSAGGSGGGGVSLTLGLHQNNGIVFSEPFPVNAAHGTFGLDASSEGYVIGSFEEQNRHFGRDNMGGQLLHDFVSGN